MSALPPLFLERLSEIIPRSYLEAAMRSFSQPGPVCIRINSLKTTREKVEYVLREQGIAYRDVSWYHDALILSGISRSELTKTYLCTNGLAYIQSLSSMLVPVIVAPKPGDHLLDMCAAPGGKCTQMAAMMQNHGSIIAIDTVRNRYYKLKSVVSLSGADSIEPRLMDARRFTQSANLFDKILVDAPCSCEGRFKTYDEKSYRYWDIRKIKEMAHKQKGLLLAASRLLKLGGSVVYATCTFAPEENEAVIDWLLKKTGNMLKVVHPGAYPVLTYPALTQWNAKPFDSQVAQCLRVCPSETMEGFFIAQLIKVA